MWGWRRSIPSLSRSGLPERTAVEALHHELTHKREIRTNKRRTAGHKVVAKRAVQPGKIVPWNAGVKMMLQVIVLVAHEKRRHPVREDRARAQDGVGLVFQERVLAHAANVDERIDDEHRNQPAVEQPKPWHQ